jgi:hypothetical protein
MKLIVDSEPVEIAIEPGGGFPEYCREVMSLLLSRNRAIGSLLLDGRPMQTIEQAEREFPTARMCEIQSVPLVQAMRTSLDSQIQRIISIEERCNTLVTESLLAEAHDIAVAWQDICAMIREQIGLLPQLAGLLDLEEVDHLIGVRLMEFNTTMRDIGDILNRADVVAFSDVLEFRLVPWLGSLRELLQGQLARVNANLSESPVVQAS